VPPALGRLILSSLVTDENGTNQSHRYHQDDPTHAAQAAPVVEVNAQSGPPVSTRSLPSLLSSLDRLTDKGFGEIVLQVGTTCCAGCLDGLENN